MLSLRGESAFDHNLESTIKETTTVTTPTDKFEDVLNFLSAAGGSCLYWQLPDPARALAAAAAGVVILDEENDLLMTTQDQVAKGITSDHSR